MRSASFLIVLLLLPAAAIAAPDCADSNAVELHETSTNTSLSISYTTPAPCVDCVAFYGAGIRTAGAQRTFSDVQLAGVGMTQIETDLWSTTSTSGFLYYDIDPPSGTNNFTATVSGTITNREQIAWTCSGVNQTTPIGDTGTNTATSSSSLSVTVTADSTQTVIDFFATDDSSGAATVGANQTLIHEGQSGSTGSGASWQAGADGGVMTWTINAADDWIHVAAALNPVEGGHILQPIYMQ